MNTKLAIVLAFAAVAVLADPVPTLPPGEDDGLHVIPADLLNINIPVPQHDDHPTEERTLAWFYTSCASTLTCTDTNYYCGYSLLAPLAGYRCYPKKCIGLCSSASQCSSGTCTNSFCSSCLGK